MSLDEISYAYSYASFCLDLKALLKVGSHPWICWFPKPMLLTVCYSTRYVGAFKPLLSEDHVIVGHFISPSLSNFPARNGKRREEGRTEEGGKED